MPEVKTRERITILQIQLFEYSSIQNPDWARRSPTGYCTLGGNFVTWNSKKHVVARSSSETEYTAMAHGMCKLLWLRKLLTDLGIIVKTLIQLYGDNKAALYISENPVFHERPKHIELD